MKMSWFSKNCLERSTLQQNIDGDIGWGRKIYFVSSFL